MKYKRGYGLLADTQYIEEKTKLDDLYDELESMVIVIAEQGNSKPLKDFIKAVQPSDYILDYLTHRLDATAGTFRITIKRAGRPNKPTSLKNHIYLYCLTRFFAHEDGLSIRAALKKSTKQLNMHLSESGRSSAYKRTKKKIINLYKEEPDFETIQRWCKNYEII